MSTRFGWPATHEPFLPRISDDTVDMDALLEAVGPVAAAFPDEAVQITVLDEHGPEPRLVVTEHERVTDTLVDDLARAMARAHVPRGQAADALSTWLHQRPATDAAAAREGVAVVDWADQHQRRVCWQVVVPRPGGTLAEWVPSLWARPTDLHAIRNQAMRRSAALQVDPWRAGDVTVWLHGGCPELSTAVLATPDRLAAVEENALDLHVVFSPHRPVACADRAAALRLTEETVEAHVMLPLADLAAVGWK